MKKGLDGQIKALQALGILLATDSFYQIKTGFYAFFNAGVIGFSGLSAMDALIGLRSTYAIADNRASSVSRACDL